MSENIFGDRFSRENDEYRPPARSGGFGTAGGGGERYGSGGAVSGPGGRYSGSGGYSGGTGGGGGGGVGGGDRYNGRERERSIGRQR